MKEKRKDFVCEKCGKIYKKSFFRDAHKLKCGLETKCQTCGKVFSKRFNRNRHSKICKNREGNLTPIPSNAERDVSTDASADNGAEEFVCPTCGERFDKRHSLKCRKCVQSREKNTTYCGICHVPCDSYRIRQKHEKECRAKRSKASDQSNFVCPICNKSFMSSNSLVAHQDKTGHVSPGSSSNTNQPIGKKRKTYTCHDCGFMCDDRKDLWSHKTVHYQSEEAEKTFQPEPWGQTGSFPPWIEEEEEEGGSSVTNEELKNVYKQHRHLILKQRKTEGSLITLYNFPVSDALSVDQMMDQLEDIYEDNDLCFKINASIGLILRHVELGTYRYFVPYHNESLFSVPLYVRIRRGLEKVRSRLLQLDVADYATRQRPNTKWKPVMVTNIVYQVYKTSYPLGLTTGLPDFVAKSKSIVSFERNPNTQKLYKDDLCFFRCLAFHRTKKRKCETMTNKLHAQ